MRAQGLEVLEDTHGISYAVIHEAEGPRVFIASLNLESGEVDRIHSKSGGRASLQPTKAEAGCVE